uniref:Retrovirus-related Pol polyprotein from transposon TNT 1-94 n=1 Tax=Cajanus cajan TaxID=3821 RepID=A0A151T8G9_CAJCA|nr:Retrovirus-related Pol polyprotein from transposon TNT 1-94 [Cajanus cajan]
MNIWVPLSTASILGHRYFLIVIDDNTRHIWIFFMKMKSEIGNLVKFFINLVENHFDKKVKCVRTDSGLEFMLK